MADTDIGNLKVGLGLDTTNLTKGVENAVKSLDKLNSDFEKTQRSISQSISSLSKRIDDNNKAMSKFTTKTTQATRNQATYLKKYLENIDRSVKKSADNTSTMAALIVQALNKLGTQMDITYALGQRDFAKGIKRLAKEVRNSSPKITSDLKRIQVQSNNTYNSLGKLSKVKGLNKGLISLGTDTLSLPSISVPDKSIATNLGIAKVNADSLGASLMSTWHTLSMISFQIYLFEQGLQQLSHLVETFVAPGWEFAKAMETNEIGMAGILSSMTKIGERELEWNEALAISKGIIQELNIEAVRTAATTEELVGTFRALLGPGLGAGFSLEEIKEFTVIGVNAVKSMGLEGRQLVQELRDLVQGGIQAASSTLATALGLTDKDIKEAKASSEGLFKFLMARLRGFEHSADATAQTLRGLESIVTEGYVLASAEALQPIMNKYRDYLKSISNAMFAEDSFELNPQFVDGFKEVADYSLMFLENTENIVVALKPVGELLLNTLVPSLKLFAEYSDVIVALWGTMFVGQKIGSVPKTLNGIKTELNGVLSAQYAVSDAVKASNEQYARLMQTALNTGKVLVEEHNREQQANIQRKQSGEIVRNLDKQGNKELANSVAGLYKHYRDLGINAEVASRLQYEGAKIAESGNKELLKTVTDETTAHIKNAKAQFKESQETQDATLKKLQYAERCTLVANRVQDVGMALSGVGVLLGWFADEENEAAQEMANMAVQGGLVLTAFSSIIQAIPNLKGALETLNKTLKNLNATMSLTKVLSTSMGAGLGIGLAVGAATVGAYAVSNDLSRDDISSRYFDSKADKERKQAEREQSERERQEANKALEKVKELQKNLVVRQNKDLKTEESRGHVRSLYKKYEQELKTALEPLKELQKEYDHIYKYDLMSTQEYVESKFSLQERALDIEIANLEKRKAVAQEMEQFADVDNFNTQIERLNVERGNLRQEAIRQLVDEYKKLDDRLFDIKKEFEGLVGVSDKAFEENTIRAYGETIVRIQKELETASEYLNKATASGNEQEIKLWETRKKSYQDAQNRLEKIISLKKLEYDATQALAQAEKIHLDIQERYLNIQGKADRLEISSLNAESQLYKMRQENLDEYIETYTTAIAKYEAMAKQAEDTESYNTYKQMALEAREELNELLNAVHPLQRVIEEEFVGSLSDMFQSMLWQEKTAKEALKDFAKSIMQTFTKQVFDNFANQMLSVIFPKTDYNATIEQKVNSKVNVDLTAFNQNITQGAQTFQEGLVYSVTRLNEFNNALYQVTQAVLTQQAGAQGGSTDKWGQMANLAVTASGIANGGEGSTSLAGIGQVLSGLTFTMGNDYLPEKQLSIFGDLSEDASDASISLGSLTRSLGSSTSATDDSAKATGSNVLAIGTMVASLLSASGTLGKFGTVLQGVMMAMQIAQATGILGFAEGGYVQGAGTSTSDSIPARLSDGEYVLKASAVKQLGVGFLDQLNGVGGRYKRSSRLPKFAYAEGGYVNAQVQEEAKSTPVVTGGVAQPTVVMQMTFQSLDPEANMKMMEAQYPQIRSRLIRDLQSNSSMRTAVKGATR